MKIVTASGYVSRQVRISHSYSQRFLWSREYIYASSQPVVGSEAFTIYYLRTTSYQPIEISLILE